MKLELKHLAPYLPYELKIARLSVNGNFKRIEYSFRATNLVEVLRYDNLKPILRPLLDLTKEIEVNGEKFVPIIELAKLFHTNKSALTHFTNIVDAGFYGISVNCHIENDDSRFTYYQLRNSEFVLSNTYEEIQKLFEWHFDVFGLISLNLAIDINTI